MKKCNVGGQAVIEGVMMRGSKGIATAVRKQDGEIEVDLKETIPISKRNKFFGLPFIRGVVTLIDSLIVGIETLNYSASFFEDEDEEKEEKSKFESFIEDKFKDKSNDIMVGLSLVLSLVFTIILFFLIPTSVASFFKFGNTVVKNLIEGAIRVLIFILYLVIIGRMEDINRLFEYHGAEHKTIFCYENEEELIPSNAAKFGRLHPRCGTNFFFLVLIISILVFSFTGWGALWKRILYRILLLPVISGITYELLRWMGRSSSTLSKIVAFPGLMLQKLTTREPDESELEVAIKALKVAEGIDEEEESREPDLENI